MLSFARHLLTPSNRSVTHGTGHTLWIDGVGCFWVLTNDRVTLGRADSIAPAGSESHVPADIPILSDLKRQHATIIRTGEGYLLEAHGPACVSGCEVVGRVSLVDNAIIELGRSVRLQFSRPTALSLSAKLDIVSDHRTAQTVDGFLLLADTCVLGPGHETHVCCADWPGTVLLVQEKAELCCRSRLSLTVNDHRMGSGQRLRSGDVIAGDDLRFRIEERSI